jgi:alkanesulfonate monooxygenase SsuD/methylene tetrahydromethanopterin reductase-like flavin-dependent oxidoreductase (luciferase family)
VGTDIRLRRLQRGETPDRAIAGTHEEIARRLREFAGVGTSHLIVGLDPVTPASIEEFGKIVEMMRG